MATHSSIPAWRIPWTEEPSRLQWGHKELDVTERLTLLPIGSDGAFQVLLVVKNLPANARDLRKMWVRSLFQEDSLEEGMATHSSIIAWRIPWTEEPSRLSSIGSQIAGHH